MTRLLRSRWAPGVLLLAVSALLWLMFLLAYVVDGRGADAVDRESTTVGASISAIHVHDDFLRPSLIDLHLDRTVAGHDAVTVRSDLEDEYHVGQHLAVEVDAHHLAWSGVTGDTDGPSWTLGVGSIGMLGGLLSGIVGVVALLVAAVPRYGRYGSYRERSSGAPLGAPFGRRRTLRRLLGDDASRTRRR